MDYEYLILENDLYRSLVKSVEKVLVNFVR